MTYVSERACQEVFAMLREQLVAKDFEDIGRFEQ